jgi:hypothetical protein
MLVRDVKELGDYAGLISNAPRLIHGAAEKIRTGLDRAMYRARGDEEETAALPMLRQEIYIDRRWERWEEEYAEAVNLIAEWERRHPLVSELPPMP